jgi:2-dehydropantoate 2-reductase
VHETAQPQFAVMGAGAVGCYFGGMLAAAGVPVTLIGRAQHVGPINRDGLFIDSINFQRRIRCAATTDVGAIRSADIVLFCVKTVGTEEAAESIAPHLGDTAVVVSMQNGVDNVEQMRAAGLDPVAASVYVAAAMTGPGCVKHSGRGDLIIGDLPGRAGKPARKPTLDFVAAVFSRAGVPCRVSDDIAMDLWTKLIMNCAYNPISALARARYKQIVQNSLTRGVMLQVVDEVVAVARAAGVRLEQSSLVPAVLSLGESMANALSSTAQDLARGKRTEIDSLNGYVARRGAELGVPTPVNQTLHGLVKLLEELQI